MPYKIMAKHYNPGERSEESGIYKIVGPRGGDIGENITHVKSKPLPSTPKSGQTYVLLRKTNR
jgi:hypothetical protein